jgi:hypothetical protein
LVPWVAAVTQAAVWAAGEGLTVVSSIGMATWDLITVAASRAGGRVHLVLPATAPEQPQILHEYGLDPERTTFAYLPGSGDRHRDMAARDEAVVAAAETLAPICLRPAGSMARLVELAAKPVVRTFEIAYSRRAMPLKYQLDRNTFGATEAAGHTKMIVHWTRTANGPWPTERMRDYCDAVLESDEYARSAFATLRNILASNRIAASPRHMPDNAPCVSFTAKPPGEFAELMRWRARYREMSFEPYGIGIAAETALALGIRPVDYAGNPATPAWLRQTPGTITDWRNECEWRHLGRVDLSTVPRDQLRCYCWGRSEAGELAEQSGVRVVTLGE